MSAPVVVGLGEVLFDVFPSGARLGGAPANFTVHSAALGAGGVLASSVGDDALGHEARTSLAAAKVDLRWLQTSHEPTSRVLVELDAGGHASYTIEAPVAWDTLEYTPEWQQLSAQADAVCFGTLGQRDVRSRATIQRFIANTKFAALRIFDVNLRAPFWNADTIRFGLKHATIVKVNEHELPVLLDICGASPTSPATANAESTDANTLLQSLPDLHAVCVTLGERGSLLAGRNATAQYPGFPISVVDTVGAGDAFTAALTWYTLRGARPEGVLAAANRLGSFVASQSGAMPPLPSAMQAELNTLAGV